MESTLKEILIELREIKEKVGDLWKFNNMDTYRDYPPFVHSNSPIKLTGVGLNILNTYKGKDLIDSIENELIEEIEKRNFQTPLDVQDFSEKLIYSRFSSEKFNIIKNLIYHQPTFENQPINIKVMSLIMGLYLRDKYLVKYPQLSEMTAIS